MMNRSLIACLMISIATLSACTQKRQQIFAQGQGTNLESIQNWKERFIDIETGEVIGTPPTTNAQENVKISEKVKSMNHFDLVQLKISDPKFKTLIGNPPFRGKPNSKGVYQAEIKLTENYLKIMKVAKPEDLPFDEHFYIEETLADGRVAIPLVGYKIKGFYNVEAQKTDDDQESHHLIEVEEQDTAKASHVRIDWSSREVFTPVKKLDLFPADLFFARQGNQEFKPYEWYYSETITEKSLSDTDAIVGENNTRVDKSNLASATKVVFLPREGELRIVNVARDERMSRDQVEQSADLNSEATMVLPIKWKDYRIQAEGTNLSMKSEEVEERKWNQRQYFEIDFPKVQSTSIAEGNNSLMDIEVDQNYMSFTIKNTIGNRSRTLHYSFLRADQGRVPYVAKISAEKDRNTFGFFTTEKPYIENWEYYTSNDYRKRVYMNRMNPAQKEIVFHLSSSSPKWLEDVAEMSVKAWDNTFAQALGKDKIHIVFSPDRVVLGDLRYNVIHLVDTLNEDGLLGFGPSTADPETGEIISASTNVYVNSIQSIAVDTIRQYMIDSLEGRIKADSSSSKAILTEVPGSLTRPVTGMMAHKFMDLAAMVKEGKVDSEKVGSFLKPTKAEIKRDQSEFSSQKCTYAEDAGLSSNARDIQKYCPAIDKIIVSNQGLSFLNGSGENNWESLWASSKEDIRECSKLITRGKLLSTLIHEIGHNFGLRHNFYGSYDKANFKESKTIFGDKIVAHSSSIMEYTDWDEDRLSEAGPYDIAAIRFGYGNQVELKDGSIVDVGNDSIEKSLSSKQKKSADLKPYLFCTDEEAGTAMNALCRLHDAGTTPKEIVQFYIDQYKRTEALRKYRRARKDTSDADAVAVSNMARTFLPVRQIYDQWRVHLADYVKKSNRYLNTYDVETYKTVLESMKNDSQYGALYEQFYDASQLAYHFLRDVAFQNNEYCIIDEGGEIKAIEFITLRDQLSEESRGSLMIRSCAEAKNLKILNQIGYPTQSYRYTKISTLEDLSDDVLGNAETRKYSFLAMSARMTNAQTGLNQFAPSMLDEPTISEELTHLYLGRVIEGVDLTSFSVPKIQPRFNAESEILKSAASSIGAGLIIPGDALGTVNKVASMQRRQFFNVHTFIPGEEVKDAKAVLSIDGRPRYTAENDTNVMAKAFIDRYNQVDQMLKARKITEELRGKIITLQLSALPAEASIPAKTLKDFATLADLTTKIQAATGNFMPCLAKKSPGLEQLFQAIDAFNQNAEKASEGGQEAIDQLLAIKLMDLIKLIKGTDVLFTAEKLSNLEPASIECMNEVNQAIEKQKPLRKELEAQEGLILNILGMYSD